MNPEPERYFTTKELAAHLRKHPSYVYAMRARGFRMIAGLTTVAKALQFLARIPHPRSRRRRRA